MEKLTKEEALKKIEELKLYVADQETEKVVIEIKNRWTGAIKFTSEKTTIKEAVIDNKANLRGANLGEADLSGADLREADLGEADLRGANLNGANLREAYLSGADLREADLGGADLREADLSGAYLNGANLREADLGEADLRGANLGGANLSGTELMLCKFTGKGGTTRIKKNQVDDFFTALGVIVED